jgi:hypothetical protein
MHGNSIFQIKLFWLYIKWSATQLGKNHLENAINLIWLNLGMIGTIFPEFQEEVFVSFSRY